MELRCQLRFAPATDAVRAVLDASSPDGDVKITIEAAGADEGEALSALAERTRELYASVCSVVETVEDLARAYFEESDA